jgi:hypothetical protein
MSDTTSTTGSESVGSVTDQIANLLMGEDKPINKEVNVRPVDDEPEDLEADDTLPEESTEDEETEVDEEKDEESEEPVTWAATLGIDDKDVALDDDGNLVGFNTKVDGKTTTVSAKDLIAGWQTNKSNTRKSQELAEQRKEFDTLKNQAAQEYIQKLDAADKLTKHLKDSFVKEYQQIDWNRLRVENPGEYAAAVQDFNMRNAEIEQILSVVDVEKNALLDSKLEEQKASFNAYLQEEAKKIVERNPTWAKPEVFKKAITEMSDFCLEAYGFTQQEFSNIQDSRMLEVVKDAMKYRKNVKEARTKLDVQVPKFQKTKNGSAAPKSKLEKLVSTAKNTKGYSQKAAQTDAVAELLKNLS